MIEIKQSTAATVPFEMLDDSNNGVAGITPTIRLRKPGGTFTASTNAATEVGSGLYEIVVTSAETDTLGDLVFERSGTGAKTERFAVEIVAVTRGDLKAIADAIQEKTTNLPAAPAATSDIPSAATIADAVWDETLADHEIAGSTGAALATSSTPADPWETVVPGSYDDGTAGAAVGRLNNTPPDAPVLVTPDPSGDANLRTVFVDTRDILGEVVSGLTIEIQLASTQPAVASGGQVVSKRPKTMEEDSGTPGRYTIALEVGLSYVARQGDLFGPDGKSFDVEAADTTVNLATA